MLSYTKPASFFHSGEGRVVSFLLATGLGLSACSGATGPTSSKSREPAASVSTTAGQLCKNGEVTKASDGTTLYCEELQASSVDVFRDVTHLFNSKYPQQLRVGETVLVRCVQAAALKYAPSANGNKGDPNSEWYVLAEPTEFKDGLTAANTFWNVTDKNTPFKSQPAVDPRVPSCGPVIQ